MNKSLCLFWTKSFQSIYSGSRSQTKISRLAKPYFACRTVWPEPDKPFVLNQSDFRTCSSMVILFPCGNFSFLAEFESNSQYPMPHHVKCQQNSCIKTFVNSNKILEIMQKLKQNSQLNKSQRLSFQTALRISLNLHKYHWKFTKLQTQIL